MDALEVVLLEHSVTTVCADVKEGMKQDMDHALMIVAPLTKGIQLPLIRLFHDLYFEFYTWNTNIILHFITLTIYNLGIGIVGKHKTTIPMFHVMATIRYVLTSI